MQWPKVNKACGRIRFTIKNLPLHLTTVQLFAESATSAIIIVMFFHGMELHVTLGEMIKQVTHTMSPLELVSYILILVWQLENKVILRITTFLLQPWLNLKLTATWLLRMFPPLGSRGFMINMLNFSKNSASQLYCFRFFYESYDSSATASLQACVNEYYLNSIPAFAVFPDDSTNKCWFGSPSVSSGSFSPTGNSWTVFIKQSKWIWIK